MASWAVLRLGPSKHADAMRPRVVLLVQQPPVVRLKQRQEACEKGTKHARTFVWREESLTLSSR